MADSPEAKQLIYDLRQYYAKILGEHLIMIANARTKRDFNEWFDWLDSLHSEIQQKFNKKERKEYHDILEETIKTLKENQGALNKNIKNTKQIANVYRALKKLDSWCRKVMEDHDMFGRKESAEGI